MADEIRHYQVNQRYRVVFERSAVKGIDGFKVEANGDDIEQVEFDARVLYVYANGLTSPQVTGSDPRD